MSMPDLYRVASFNPPGPAYYVAEDRSWTTPVIGAVMLPLDQAEALAGSIDPPPRGGRPEVQWAAGWPHARYLTYLERMSGNGQRLCQYALAGINHLVELGSDVTRCGLTIGGRPRPLSRIDPRPPCPTCWSPAAGELGEKA